MDRFEEQRRDDCDLIGADGGFLHQGDIGVEVEELSEVFDGAACGDDGGLFTGTGFHAFGDFSGEVVVHTAGRAGGDGDIRGES